MKYTIKINLPENGEFHRNTDWEPPADYFSTKPGEALVIRSTLPQIFEIVETP